MTKLKVTLHSKSKVLRFFPKGIDGVTIGSNIHFRGNAADASPTLVNHELIHVCQYADRDLGGIFKKMSLDDIIFFLFHYYTPLNQKYRKKPEEIEAYSNEADMGYIARRWPNYQIEIVG